MLPKLVVTLVALSVVAYLAMFPLRLCDFRAFYCAGRAAIAGQDPYREHPLHECEHGLVSPFLSVLPSEITVPAPFPGYAIAAFSFVARLPFNWAVVIWTVLSFAAMVASVLLLARTTASSLGATAIVVGFPATIIALPLGQPTVFVLLAIAVCATLLQACRPRYAAFVALATAIEPSVGLAFCFGLFVGVPKTRVVLLSGALGLPLFSLLTFGPAREWEYFHDVLPAHAMANVAEFSQFSTANIAYTVGVKPGIALILGNAWYAVSLAVGVICSLRLRSQLGMPAIAFVPVAFAVFGGSHTHFQQLAFATPAFLLVASAADGALRRVLVWLTFGASIPWLIVAPFPMLFPPIAVIGVAFARLMGTAGMSRRLGATAFALTIALCAAVVESQRHPGSHVVPTLVGNPLAEVSWSLYVRTTSMWEQAWFFIMKVPTVLAFLAMFALIVKAALGASRGEALRAPHQAIRAVRRQLQ